MIRKILNPKFYPGLAVVLLPSISLAQDAGVNGANTAWILTSTALVLFMTLPGLSLFLRRTGEKQERTLGVDAMLLDCGGYLPALAIDSRKPVAQKVTSKNIKSLSVLLFFLCTFNFPQAHGDTSTDNRREVPECATHQEYQLRPAVMRYRNGRAEDCSGLYDRGFKVMKVAIFGDGDPSTGIEDDRQIINTKHPLGKQMRAIGRTSCTDKDGEKTSGSATLVDTSQFNFRARRSVILTAAHVLGGKVKCDFHPFASASSVPINLEAVAKGNYDPKEKEFATGHAEEDWAFAKLKTDLRGSEALKPWVLPVDELSEYYDEGGRFRYVGWNNERKRISVTKRFCRVGGPNVKNLAQGSKKVLLDSCDSTAGSSGGAMMAVLKNGENLEGLLVGLRGGDIYSPDHYSDAPPAGERFSSRKNANYSRMIDQEMLEALEELVNRRSL